MTENDHAVRITNQAIYDAVMAQGKAISRLEGRFSDVVKPTLDRNSEAIEGLKNGKADKAETAELRGSINSVRIQAYAIGGGVLSGLVVLNALGFFRVTPQ